MRTYLQIGKPMPGPNVEPELLMVCNCGKTKRLAEFVPQAARPNRIQSINLLRLLQWMGDFASEHAACPNEAPAPVKKSDDDIPF